MNLSMSRMVIPCILGCFYVQGSSTHFQKGWDEECRPHADGGVHWGAARPGELRHGQGAMLSAPALYVPSAYSLFPLTAPLVMCFFCLPFQFSARFACHLGLSVPAAYHLVPCCFCLPV